MAHASALLCLHFSQRAGRLWCPACQQVSLSAPRPHPVAGPQPDFVPSFQIWKFSPLMALLSRCSWTSGRRRESSSLHVLLVGPPLREGGNELLEEEAEEEGGGPGPQRCCFLGGVSIMPEIVGTEETSSLSCLWRTGIESS